MKYLLILLALGCGGQKEPDLLPVDFSNPVDILSRDTLYHEDGDTVIHGRYRYVRYKRDTTGYNVGIGRGAGHNLFGTLCVIIGRDSAAQNATGDMLWIVDYNEPLLTNHLKELLRDYEKRFIKAGKDTRDNRLKFIKRFSEAISWKEL